MEPVNARRPLKHTRGRRLLSLAIVSSLAASCGPAVQRSGVVVQAGEAGGERREIDQAIEKLRRFADTRRFIQSQGPRAQDARPAFSYRGREGFRHIDDYTDLELESAAQDELAILVKVEHAKLPIARRLKAMGYEVGIGLYDHLVVRLPESGSPALKKHFRILDAMEGVAIVGPRFSLRPAMCLDGPPPSNDTYACEGDLGQIDLGEAGTYATYRDSDYVVAVVDTGVNAHADLTGRLVAGIDSTPTWTWGDWDSGWFFPDYSSDVTDSHGHGTLMAGMVAAVTNNGAGIASAGWGSRVMPIAANTPRATDSFNHDDIRAGIIWAVDHGAKVVNLSMSGPGGSGFLREAVLYALDRGRPVIAAAGNKGGSQLRYPAAYSAGTDPRFDNLVAVAGADPVWNPSNPAIWHWTRNASSNYGPDLSMAAPWSALSTERSGGYLGSQGGTSFSTAIVSGAFASLWHACKSLPGWQVKEALYAAAEDEPGTPDYNTNLGYGVLNIGRAATTMLNSGLIYSWREQWYEPYMEAHWYSPFPDQNPPGAAYDGIPFRLRPASQPGTTPLYRYFRSIYGPWNPPTRIFRKLSTNPNLQAEGWSPDGVIGWIGTCLGCGGMNGPLHELTNSGDRYLYLLDQGQIQTAINAGWQDRGVIGYVW